MQNRLKVDSTKTIKELQNAKIKCIMVTGNDIRKF